MKIWTMPAAISQTFAANDDISACFNVKCKADNSTTWPGTAFTQAILDTNGNGVYDADVDTLYYKSGSFYCCNQYHTVKSNGPIPENHNAFLIDTQGNVVPVYLWEGDAIGENPDPSGTVKDFHCTSFNVADAVVLADNPNHS